jgi:hypothetical protein
LREQRDGLQAELLLNSVEVVHAEADEDGRDSAQDTAHAPFIKRAREIERVCREGDGLESCEQLAAIEAVVASME